MILIELDPPDVATALLLLLLHIVVLLVILTVVDAFAVRRDGSEQDGKRVVVLPHLCLLHLVSVLLLHTPVNLLHLLQSRP